ncbi:MAG: hypothetical protein L0229_20045 [Blastocatellia bacterium]|nr:hypothetical protein [Blastocatellia bacterium]
MIPVIEPTISDKEKISFRLAAWLLLLKNQVSFSELEALPTVTDSSDVEEIIDYLVSHFDAEKVTEKIASWPILSWETVVKLRTPGKLPGLPKEILDKLRTNT